jgi:hypothetical protein
MDSHDLQMSPVLAIVFIGLQADNLEVTFDSQLLIQGWRVEHVSECRPECLDIFLSMLGNSILFLDSHSADWRVREDYSGNIVITHLEVGSSIEDAL